MSKTAKRLVLLSMVVAAGVALASVADLVMGVPFAGAMLLDGMLLVGAGLVLYMGYETYREAS